MVPGDEDILPRKRGRQEVGDKHALSLHKAPGARMTQWTFRGAYSQFLVRWLSVHWGECLPTINLA